MSEQPEWLNGTLRKIAVLEDLDKRGLIRVGDNGEPVWADDGSPVIYDEEAGIDREQILGLIARADKLLDEHDCRMGDSRANEAQELLQQALEPKPQP